MGPPGGTRGGPLEEPRGGPWGNPGGAPWGAPRIDKWHACPGSYKQCFVVVVLLCIDREGQKER